MSKERFKCYYCAGIENILVEDTINNETYIEDNIVNLLNQQDKQIKELEQQLNKDFTLGEYIRLEEENQQLKQQLTEAEKQIAISKLEMLHDMFCSNINNRMLQNYVCSNIRMEIEELKNDGKL